MPANKSKITIICDRTDMTSANGDIEFVKHIASFFQDNFPERMHTCIIYPSGFLFYGLWNIVKWFLDPVTANKVQPHGYLSGVQEFIDDINLIFLNCIKYNGEDSSVGKMCKNVREEFQRLYNQFNIEFYR